jgi:hypothetical protein
MVNTEVFLKSWDKWLLADCAFLILGFEECLIFCEINPIAVAEMGGAIGLRVNGWRPNSIGPTGFIVVGQAHSSALRARPEITESTFDRVKYGFTT